MPFAPTLFGNPDGGALFSAVADDPFSVAAMGASPLAAWIPNQGTTATNFTVSHLTAIGPENFTGEDDYLTFLASQDPVDVCNFGPGADFDVFEYSHTMHRMSFSNQTKKLYKNHYGASYWQNSPRRAIRGPNSGQLFTNDADWTLAGLAEVREQHRNWVLLHGDPTIPSGNGMFEGLDSILTPGWVLQHRRGTGSGNYTDPIIVNAGALDTPEKIVKMLKAVVRKLLMRMYSRGYVPAMEDFAIVMHPTHWTYISEAVASGALANILASNVQMNTTAEAWQREHDRVVEGGLGYGFLPIDNRMVPIIPETNLGRNVTLADSTPAVIGDMYILTRRFKGEDILQQYYFDYGAIESAQPFGENRGILQNGAVRYVWNEENNVCYWYAIEEEGALLTRMSPLQAKIQSVVVETELANEAESETFTSQDWYMYDGARGGQGAVLWSGI